MTDKVKRLLWVMLAITLILSFSGIYLRMSNESKNNTIVTTIDYGEFLKTANLANMDMDNILTRLKAKGVHTVAVNEVTLRDLANAGKINILSYGDFSSFNRVYFPSLWGTAQRAIGSRSISPDALVIASPDAATGSFLRERLSARFTPSEMLTFSDHGTDYFIMTTELKSVNVTQNQSGKTKVVGTVFDARLGFDNKVLDLLKSKGFDIVLRPGYNTGSNTRYLAEYEQTIRKYGVKYLVFGDNELNGAPNHLAWIEKPIEKYGLTVGIIETSQQIGYIKQNGLDQVMAATGYRINRVYSTSNDDFVSAASERYYRWVRGTIDRGIRILYVVPFKDSKVTYTDNINNTITMVGKYNQTMTAKGYDLSSSLPRMSAQMPGKAHRLAVSLSLLLAGMLYLGYLFKMKPHLFSGLLGLGALACLGINVVTNADFSKVYALGAAVLYPSLSSLLLMLYLKQNRGKPFWSQLITSLVIIMGINAMGMYTVVTSLADIRYIMNIGVFSGVKIAFMLPLLLFILNYLCCFGSSKHLLENVRTYLLKQPNYLILFLLAIAAAVLYIYVGRSGNNSGITVSGLEVRTREILENIFFARPRFKELAIGYPCLWALVYLYRKYGKNYIALILGAGVMIGSISMVNSFCHVFTAVTTSIRRTWAGFITGTIIAVLVVLVIWLVEKLVGRYGHKTQSN